jgi:3-deoxy-D-manno-octulosonic-acid transferase
VNRALYSFLWWPATPLLAIYLCWRARAQPAYLRHWGQRWALGWPSFRKARLCVWVHAVSVGETRAAAPLIKALLARYPNMHIVLSHGTPTGRETGQALFAQVSDRVLSVYLPYDYAYASKRFLAHFAPTLGLVMETEVWPNLMQAALQAKLPVVLVNGRLSQKSLDKALAQSKLMVPALRAFRAIYAQTSSDAARLRTLGVDSRVLGNLKFDMPVDTAMLALGRVWRKQLAGKRIILLASSREGEESLLLEAIGDLAQKFPDDIELAIVPRHPQRFDDVAKTLKNRGAIVSRRSEPNFPSRAERTVLLGDSMGELQAFYALADVVIMGGTFAGTGGQNLIEAAALGCPVVLGPSIYNFAQASEQAVQAGAAFAVSDATQAWKRALELISNEVERKKASDAALAFSHQHAGALANTLAEINALLLLSSSV